MSMPVLEYDKPIQYVDGPRDGQFMPVDKVLKLNGKQIAHCVVACYDEIQIGRPLGLYKLDALDMVFRWHVPNPHTLKKAKA